MLSPNTLRFPRPPRGIIRPPGIPIIDWSHPLAQGLVLAMIPDSYVTNLAAPNTISSTLGVSFSAGFPGLAVRNPATSAINMKYGDLAGQSGYSIFSIQAASSVPASNSASPILDQDGELFANRIFQYRYFNGNGTLECQFIFFDNNSTQNAYVTTSNSLTAAQLTTPATMSARVNYVEGIGYLTFNGARALSPASSVLGVATLSRSAFSSGVNLFTTNTSPSFGYFVGNIYASYMWKRKLSDAEDALLHTDPYCFLIFPGDQTYTNVKAKNNAITRASVFGGNMAPSGAGSYVFAS